MAFVRLSNRERVDSVLTFLNLCNSALGNSGVAQKNLGGKLFHFCRDLFQTNRVDHSFMLAASLVCRVDRSAPGSADDETVRRCLARGDFRSPEWLISGRESGATDELHSHARRP